ncbi:MAG: DNA-3-methyladenine glycosylase 2 family protein [Firmicutes bacterium]|nr:DNA-3-methyladenine glycosylase 2 family protein [Bacillota bacterium]
MFIQYGEEEITHLKERDKQLGAAIDKIGPVKRRTDSDLFSSVVRHIVGQQISTAAQRTVWQRMCNTLGDITPSSVKAVTVEDLQANGITFKKAEYIKDFADKVLSGEFDIDSLFLKNDDEVIARLSTLKGVGTWTAEMVMIFCMQRPDILSFGDLAIRRGMQRLYGHKKISHVLFEKYRRRYSPYGTTASLYLWAIAGKVNSD